jgi:hypothetical protein
MSFSSNRTLILWTHLLIQLLLWDHRLDQRWTKHSPLHYNTLFRYKNTSLYECLLSHTYYTESIVQKVNKNWQFNRTASFVIPMPKPKAGVSPLISCLWLLIQYIRSHPPYLEASSTICNIRTHHVVVTRGKNLVGKPEGKRPLGRPRCTWEDNIKMYLRETG